MARSPAVRADRPDVPTKPPDGTLVFVSHDSRDASLAEAFSKLLSSVSAGVLKTFRSSDQAGQQGIPYGSEWYPEVMKRLSAASNVVCLLTPRSLERPWILYEAGVARGGLDTTVLGIALGVPLARASSGPFAQFQNCGDDIDSLTKLVLQLLQKVPNSEPDPEIVRLQVEVFTRRVADFLRTIGAEEQIPKAAAEDVAAAKLFEEIKAIVQELPARIDGRVLSALEPAGRRRMSRIHPTILHEVLRFGGHDLDAQVGGMERILILGGILRDDLPWVYDAALSVYNASHGGRPRELLRSARSMLRIVRFTQRSRIGRELRGAGPDLEITLHEFELLCQELLTKVEPPGDGPTMERDEPKASAREVLPPSEQKPTRELGDPAGEGAAEPGQAERAP